MKTSQKIRVAIIDDQEVARFGVRAALENDDRIIILAEGAAESDALLMVNEHHPDVLLLGLNNMAVHPHQAHHVFPLCDTIRYLAKQTATKVLVLSRYAHKGLLQAIVLAGASGFVLKEEMMSSGAELTQVVVLLTALKGELLISHQLRQNFYSHDLWLKKVPYITPRRVEMMQAIADNPQLTQNEVAGLLGIAESTLRNNLSTLFRALDTPGLNGALIECLRLGLIQINQ